MSIEQGADWQHKLSEAYSVVLQQQKCWRAKAEEVQTHAATPDQELLSLSEAANIVERMAVATGRHIARVKAKAGVHLQRLLVVCGQLVDTEDQ